VPSEKGHEAEVYNNDKAIHSSSLSKSLETLKHEIIELKQSKSVLEIDFENEKRKNKLFEKEIQDLKKTIQEYKIKEISEGEKMLRLEIDNLTNSLNFRSQENELLRRENEMINKQLVKFEGYFKEYIENSGAVNKQNYEEVNEAGLKKEKTPGLFDGHGFEENMNVDNENKASNNNAFDEQYNYEEHYHNDNKANNEMQHYHEPEFNHHNEELGKEDVEYDDNKQTQYEGNYEDDQQNKDNIVHVPESKEEDIHRDNNLKEPLIQEQQNEQETKPHHQEDLFSNKEQGKETNLFDNADQVNNNLFTESPKNTIFTKIDLPKQPPKKPGLTKKPETVNKKPEIIKPEHPKPVPQKQAVDLFQSEGADENKEDPFTNLAPKVLLINI
jgi:hypothetical protein